MTETKVIEFPKGRRARVGKTGDEQMANNIRKAQRKLCRLIDEATAAGLKVRCHLDANETYNGDRIRSIDATVTRTI
jgi:hypothetical protein